MLFPKRVLAAVIALQNKSRGGKLSGEGIGTSTELTSTLHKNRRSSGASCIILGQKFQRSDTTIRCAITSRLSSPRSKSRIIMDVPVFSVSRNENPRESARFEAASSTKGSTKLSL